MYGFYVMEWSPIAVREGVIDSFGMFRWGDDLFVNRILNCIAKGKATVSIVTVLLMECAILGVVYRSERIRERSRIEQFEIPFLHQYPQCTGWAHMELGEGSFSRERSTRFRNIGK